MSSGTFRIVSVHCPLPYEFRSVTMSDLATDLMWFADAVGDILRLCFIEIVVLDCFSKVMPSSHSYLGIG